MLQQTRVEVVLPYYERFLHRFPTVDELAGSPLDEVLALWSGLGYYRRARQLHAAAVRIAAAGELPRTVAGWLELPGVGAYTAAAVTSIAFGVAAPVLDGNVERVMARRLALAEDPKLRGARALLLAGALALLDPARPGDSNQALMEVGATICLPRRPRCLLCPLRPGCVAAHEGQPERFPPPRRKRQSESRRLLIAVATRGDRVLLFRRSRQSELLAGTWELPWLELPPAGVTGDPPAALALAEKYGGGHGWRLGPVLAVVRHGITYRDLEVSVCRGELWPAAADEVREEGAESGWFDAGQRAALPTSSLVGKALRALAAAESAEQPPRDRRTAGRRRLGRQPQRPR